MGGKRGSCPPPPFSRDKEQNLQFTCVDLPLGPSSLTLFHLAGHYSSRKLDLRKQLLSKELAISSTGRELH